ncbi:MAG: ABC-F family ATP-binding cassette domain-containing protein [Deltaproteobacteria bacterium]|nr:ABC-F family ATP-binding cassette domain-containing protein [Deltaproteobacteria bacterium]
MPPLLRLSDVGLSFGGRALFEHVSLTVDAGERLGVIGRNGCGKTSLLSGIAGELPFDEGECRLAKGVRLARVVQEPSFPAGLTCREAVLEALRRLPASPHEEGPAEDVRVTKALASLGFEAAGQAVETLSGGWRKRLAIACALVSDPDLVLLDEPTNHLDLEGIVALEDLIRAQRAAFVLVTHDRVFLERTVTRMVELDRRYPGGTFTQAGTYSRFLEKRAELLAGRAQSLESLDNRVRRELEWLHRGPKARATKAQGRIDEAHRMMDELARMQADEKVGRAELDFAASGRRTRRLVVARNLGCAPGGRRLFEGLDLVLGPGRRLGLVGPNGSGKTTLLRLLAGELRPDQGELRFAEHVQVVTFDQHRGELDPDQTLKAALAPAGDAVIYLGRSMHVVGWAARFGFDPGALQQPVGRLSGGERARVQIARLMLRPADVLLLDEPTNDLDIATLEVLEDALLDFPGALVLVSHDRYLVDRVCTTLLALDGEGRVSYLADLAQWEAEREARRGAVPKVPRAAPPVRPRDPGKSLSWKEKRELEGMEAAIGAAEGRLAAATRALDDPAIASSAVDAERWYRAQGEARAEVDALYARWAELEAKRPAVPNS